MSTTWYKVDTWSNTITPVEVLKETASFVTIVIKGYSATAERRVAKAKEYFPTFSDARSYLMGFTMAKRDGCKREMDAYDLKWNKLFHQDEPDKEKQFLAGALLKRVQDFLKEKQGANA